VFRSPVPPFRSLLLQNAKRQLTGRIDTVSKTLTDSVQVQLAIKKDVRGHPSQPPPEPAPLFWPPSSRCLPGGTYAHFARVSALRHEKLTAGELGLLLNSCISGLGFWGLGQVASVHKAVSSIDGEMKTLRTDVHSLVSSPPPANCCGGVVILRSRWQVAGSPVQPFQYIVSCAGLRCRFFLFCVARQSLGCQALLASESAEASSLSKNCFCCSFFPWPFLQEGKIDEIQHTSVGTPAGTSLLVLLSTCMPLALPRFSFTLEGAHVLAAFRELGMRALPSRPCRGLALHGPLFKVPLSMVPFCVSLGAPADRGSPRGPAPVPVRGPENGGQQHHQLQGTLLDHSSVSAPWACHDLHTQPQGRVGPG